MDGGYVKAAACLILLVPVFVVSICGTARSSSIPASAETSQPLETAIERTPDTYHLVTAPSINKKKVDAMCIKFLSLIPKAMLIPKTEERAVFRLVANTYDRLESAKKRKAELSHHGMDTFIVVDDTGYSVIAGSHVTETLALEEQRQLAARNVTATIREQTVPLKEWQMKSTQSFTIREAVIMANKLAKLGVITTLVPAAY